MTRTIKQYSESFRKQVVAEYEAGAGIRELNRKYGITGNGTIQRWISKYAKEGFRHKLVRIQTADEIQRVRELENRVQELQQALGQMTLEKLKLESTLEVLKEDGGDIKKNEHQSSTGLSKKSSNKTNCE